MKTQQKLPKPATYTFDMPDDLPPLPGTLSRRARVEIALDVIATLKSRQRKLQLKSMYFEPNSSLPGSGPLHTSRLPTCYVCARGILFLKSVDRFNKCDMKDMKLSDGLIVNRSLEEWGRDQTYLVESAFEGKLIYRGSLYEEAVRNFRFEHAPADNNRKPLMIAICENIVNNHGEFKP